MTKTTTRCFRDAKIVNLYEATPDARGFFESVLGFSGLDGGFFRVSAADQRRYFGRVPFGKCAIQVGRTASSRSSRARASAAISTASGSTSTTPPTASAATGTTTRSRPQEISKRRKNRLTYLFSVV